MRRRAAAPLSRTSRLLATRMGLHSDGMYWGVMERTLVELEGLLLPRRRGGPDERVPDGSCSLWGRSLELAAVVTLRCSCADSSSTVISDDKLCIRVEPETPHPNDPRSSPSSPEILPPSRADPLLNRRPIPYHSILSDLP